MQIRQDTGRERWVETSPLVEVCALGVRLYFVGTGGNNVIQMMSLLLVGILRGQHKLKKDLPNQKAYKFSITATALSLTSAS